MTPARKGRRISLVAAFVIWVISVAATVFITRAVVLRSASASSGVAEASSQAVSTSVEGKEAETTAQDNATQGESKDATFSSATSSEGRSSDGKSDGKSTSGDDEKQSETTSKASTGVKSPWTTSGTYTSGDETLDEEVKKFCDGIAKTDMDIDTAALEVYKGVAWSDYVERDEAQYPAGKNWRIVYARQYYESGCSGNCYEFAAFLSFCLQYMGFDDAQAEAVIIEMESGSWGDHGVVFVTNTDGMSCMCDTALGTNGWMLKDTAYNLQIEDVENR